ncbi:DEAD-box ATP-dependent RNA helicase 46-like [Humulus lupulus]|uniref:DEAD-box ATP-dependent RNA helicase 46-like n=1 Tax=Humulus lupulus TaxID=3486 RepID=UPI002B40AB93|nr:DEAD-box ATP-dependent RNA helicase 46-like [Humulus lupulus]XP_062095037.1 DEAD-box ATP-dependent RNA helicase 46-like [Humulus lupulus]
MATAEPASASTGPRYAPDDPTLPKPWKGLIDGSTGILYYWNPETNVTQYEKPASAPPPLPLGPPPAAAPTPKLAPIPVAHSVSQQNNGLAQHGQQMMQVSQQQQQQQGNQHGHLMSQQGQAIQQHGQVQQHGQMMQHPSQQMQHQMYQQIPQASGHQMPQPLGQQTPQSQGSQMVAPPQTQQYTHQPPLQYMAYNQQGIPPQGHQSTQQQQTQHGVQVQPFANQPEYKSGYSKREEDDFQNRNQIGFSPSQFQQPSGSGAQNFPSGANSAQMLQMGAHSGQAQQFSGTLHNMQQPTAMGQLQPTVTDSVYNPHGGRLQNERDSSAMHGQHSNMPPVGLRMGHENNMQGRGGNDYVFSGNKEPPIAGPQQPKIASIPGPRFQQDTRSSGVPYPNVAPNQVPAINNGAGQAMHSQATGGPPLPNNATMKPPYFGNTEVTNFSPAEIYRQQHEVTASGDNVPAPFATFEATGFPPEILRDIYSAGFSSPTPIQAQTWPIALQSRDIVAIAKTGSGKTLGYLMPAFMLLRQRHNNAQNGPTVLVLAPTRELATQIQDEVIKFGRSSRVSCTCLYGGAPKGPQLKELDRGADIVVATPGRLNDILEMKKIDFGQISLLVLDEADRMLDMGFEPQIRKIVNEIPPRRQTLMYTATWPKEVRKIAGDLLVNPVQVNIGRVDELAANKAITQYVEVVPQMEKQRRLEQILRSQERGSKVIIFCSTKRLCDQLARTIGRNFGAAAIHGDKSQGERDWVLSQFKSGKSPILVATDVAARGLDIKDIRVVVNYDFPTGVEDYVHRIGRTGRAGATGVSYTFFSEQDWKYAADLIKVLEGANQHVPPEVREIAMRGGPGFGKDRRFDSGGGGRGGMRDGGFGGRGGMRDGNFGNHGGMRDGGFGGRGGPRDGAMSGFGGRGDFFGGRGNRGRGFGGPGAGNVGFGRNERVNDRYNNMDARGRGGGRGRGRFDNRREVAGRSSRGRSYSRSPERVRTWGYSRSPSRSRSRSRSWSRSRSRSYSRSRSRSRSWSRGRGRSKSRSPRRSRSRSHSRNRGHSPSYDKYESTRERLSDQKDPAPPAADTKAPTETKMSSMSPGTQGNAFSETEAEKNTEPEKPVVGENPEPPEVQASPPADH